MQTTFVSHARSIAKKKQSDPADVSALKCVHISPSNNAYNTRFKPERIQNETTSCPM